MLRGLGCWRMGNHSHGGRQAAQASAPADVWLMLLDQTSRLLTRRLSSDGRMEAILTYPLSHRFLWPATPTSPPASSHGQPIPLRAGVFARAVTVGRWNGLEVVSMRLHGMNPGRSNGPTSTNQRQFSRRGRERQRRPTVAPAHVEWPVDKPCPSAPGRVVRG